MHCHRNSYDPAMRLAQLVGTATTKFAYDGLDLIAEYDAANTRAKRYVHGANTDQPLVEYDGSGTTTKRWLHADERGSVVALSDTSGAVTMVNRYDEFGKPQLINAGRFQYTGQIWLPEIGRYYYKTRMYDPAGGGRFMQTDWIGYAGGMNQYAYVGNDPVNFVDPIGTMCTILNRGKSWYQLMNNGSLGPYLGPVEGSQWVQTFGDCGGPTGGAGDQGPSRPERPEKNDLRSKKQICTALRKTGFGVVKAWGVLNSARKATTNGKTNWNNPFLREAENWLTAAADYLVLPFARTPQVYIHQYRKKLSFSETTPFSQQALDAGLDGLKHSQDTPKQLKEWCDAK